MPKIGCGPRSHSHRVARNSLLPSSGVRSLCLIACLGALLAVTTLSCNSGSGTTTVTGPVPDYRADPFLDTLETRTFNWFWETTNSTNGLVPDRWPTKSFSSVAAIGFGLTAYPIGVERGYVTRSEARDRVLRTLRFFQNAPQGPATTGTAGYNGFFYRYLDMKAGTRSGSTR